MADFASLGLSSKTLRAVKKLGYEQATPVQEQAIPLVLEGRDVIAGAQTGTGKTAAFCLPCLDRLEHADVEGGPLMLVITPTRELADQIGGVCRTVARFTKHNITTVVGGVSYDSQREELEAGTDVLIATPGRLEDLIAQGAALLDEVSVLVIDEADRMMDMGFLPAVKRIVNKCENRSQTLLFSATIDDAVMKVSKEMLNDPVQVEIAHRGETAETIKQYIVHISHAAKPSALKAIFEDRGAERVLVFARTRHRADACARRIKRMGIAADAIHSDRSQNQRRRALEAFAKGKLKVLVATDVLARGIDIDQVDYVVNFDLPHQPEDYIHRIGRTGRAGAQGYSISLVNPEAYEDLQAIQKLIGFEIPVLELPNFDAKAAEQNAEARSRQLQARRSQDPEIESVVKEINAKARKERKKAALKKQTQSKALIQANSNKAKSSKSNKKSKQKTSAAKPQNQPNVRKSQKAGSDTKPAQDFKRSNPQQRGSGKVGQGKNSSHHQNKQVKRAPQQKRGSGKVQHRART